MKDKPARDAVQDAGFLFCEFCGDELFFAVLTLLVPAPTVRASVLLEPQFEWARGQRI